MDKVDFAVRRYQQILPVPVDYVQGAALHRLKVWLTDDVCPVIEDYARRATFREHASWALRTIAPGSQTPERQEVEAVDRAVARCARAFSKLALKPRVHKQLIAKYPPQKRSVDAPHLTGHQGDSVVAVQPIRLDHLAVELAQVGELAQRPGQDLVNVRDYFEPQQEYVRYADGRTVQRGEFIVSVNPRLHPIGNFVVRCMFRRVDLALNGLRAVRHKLASLLPSMEPRNREQDEAEQAWQALQDAVGPLRQTHQSGVENQLRDSCTVLTQIYAAFAPSPQLAWLQVSPEQRAEAVETFHLRITTFQNFELFDRVVAALGDLKKLYADEAPQQSAKEEAIAAGGLVIDEHRYAVYWGGQLIGVEWNGSMIAWDFLCALARKAGLQGDVTESDLYDDSVVSRSIMATNAGRLKKLLPPALRKQIIPGRIPRSYRLDLPPHRVHQFR